MNKNKQSVKKQIPKALALATMTSVIVGGQSQAAIENVLIPPLPNDDSSATPELPNGPYGGFFGDVANIHEKIQTTLNLSEAPMKGMESEEISEIETLKENTIDISVKSENFETEPTDSTESSDLSDTVESTDVFETQNSIESSEVTDIVESTDTAVEESVSESTEDTTQSEVIYSKEDYEISSLLCDTPLFADVKTVLNIRDYPSLDGEIVGKLRPSDSATIVSYTDGWYEIVSGEIRGFVSEKYALVGKEADILNEELTTPSVTCTTQTLNIRTDADNDADIVEKISYNDSLVIDMEADVVDGWIGVIVGDKTGYVNEEFVEVFDGKLNTALTPEEAATTVIHNAPLNVSADDETLLAALLICEAGATYEGMLAVGGVVMNRLRAGYSDSIRGVIYQRGQFSPAGSGKVDRTLASGVTDASRRAAREALSGVDITGGCLNFRAAFTGHAGTNIGGNVFF